jgi:hypothetical protein
MAVDMLEAKAHELLGRLKPGKRGEGATKQRKGVAMTKQRTLRVKKLNYREGT